MPDAITADQVQAQVLDALARDGRTPRGIRLGQAQVDAILASHRATSGSQDVGPLVEFAGIPVLPSRSADRLALEYEGDPDEEEAPTTVTLPVAPSGPDTPSETESGG